MRKRHVIFLPIGEINCIEFEFEFYFEIEIHFEKKVRKNLFNVCLTRIHTIEIMVNVVAGFHFVLKGRVYKQ